MADYPEFTIPIWAGSGSAVSGTTPFGFYDSDVTFQSHAPKMASWVCNSLGYPIVDIELQDTVIYAKFEEAITEYAAQVNQFNIRNNLINVVGMSASINLTGKEVRQTLAEVIDISKEYGQEAGVGGRIDFKTGSIAIKDGQQMYDLNGLWANVSESGNRIEIKRIFHHIRPASVRYFDPYSNVGAQNMLAEFGMANMSAEIQYVITPVYDDLLRMQSIEFNDQIRRSHFSFELVNNKLRIFPVPTYDNTLWFEYIVMNDRNNATADSGTGMMTDYSNINYGNIPYSSINDVGRQWIRRYTLALCKETLGLIRSKYANLPIPADSVPLDGDTLRSEAVSEKEFLINQLRENLEKVGVVEQLQKVKEASEAVQGVLTKVPLPIYIG